MTAFDTDGEPFGLVRGKHNTLVLRVTICAARRTWRQMDLLGQMKVFVASWNPGGLTAAARHLRVSAGDCSRQLLALRADARAPLILRTTRRCTVTDAGRQYYERCLRVSRDRRRPAVGAGRQDGPGVLTVSAPVSGPGSCVSACPSLLAQAPRLAHPTSASEDRVVDIVSDGVDIAIRSGIDPPDRRLAHRATANDLRASPGGVAGLPGSARRARGPRKLWQVSDLLLHLGAPGIAPGWQLFGEGREVKVEGLTSFRTNALFALRTRSVRAGVALLPDWLVRDEIKRGALHLLLPA